jgi:acylphosphatase
MKKRLHADFTGQVQGVGFRYTARSAARGLGITGWVRNTNDGGVELVAEGEESDLKAMLTKIKEDMNYTSFKASVNWGPGTGEFKDFAISF